MNIKERQEKLDGAKLAKDILISKISAIESSLIEFDPDTESSIKELILTGLIMLCF